MNHDQVIENTKNFVSKIFENESSGHDIWHTLRVCTVALMIAKNEEADLFIVQMAALLHDVYDEKLNLSSKAQVIEFLNSQNLNPNVIDSIMYIIENQSFKKTIGNNHKLKTIEAKIVQDADRLDALGAIGIARTFAYGGSKGKEIHNPNKKPDKYSSQEEYINSNNTALNHFYEKLLSLKDLMNTKTAKKIAEGRHMFMVQFLDEFFDEWDGKK